MKKFIYINKDKINCNCILVLAFGSRGSSVNKEIGKILGELKQIYPEVLFIVQSDIPVDNRDRKTKIISLHPAGKRLDSRSFLEQAFEICQKELSEEPRPLILAFPKHVIRASKQALIVGFKEVFVYLWKCNFPKDSTQWWTKGPVRWWLMNNIVAKTIVWFQLQKAGIKPIKRR